VRVGIPRETTEDERRVALVPETVGKLAGAGFELVAEQGAGAAASFPDEAYTEAGAAIGDPWEADGVVKVRKPSADELGRLRSGQLLIGFLEPLSDPAGIEALAGRGVTAFALESVPRITRAQSMDALSSQATVGGYRAALLAAEHLPRFFPMLMTAAGTVPPAKVLVIGAGVAGLQAIATARRLGAVTTAPSRLAVAIACRPATPAPITSTFAGGTVPAAVISIGKKRGSCSAASSAPL
jgi:NAD(P) transhydrogenase subunit alpha